MASMLLIALHVMANLVWIGSIACVGWLLPAAARAPTPEARATIAEVGASIYRRIATPAFVASFVFGVAQLALNATYYMKSHWFHGKLTMALVVIGLHHVIGAKSKRAASGKVQGGESGAILTAALLVSAFVAVVLAIYKTALVP
jgi:putative membrane protein